MLPVPHGNLPPNQRTEHDAWEKHRHDHLDDFAPVTVIGRWRVETANETDDARDGHCARVSSHHRLLYVPSGSINNHRRHLLTRLAYALTVALMRYPGPVIKCTRT